MARPFMYHIARRLRDQWLTPRKLNDLQLKKLRQTIEHAYRRVPYYHNLFRSQGVRPDDIKSTRDLASIPMLTKNEARHNLRDLLARGVDRTQIEWYATGGTSGSPISVARDIEYHKITQALVLRGRVVFLEMPWERRMVITHPESQFGSRFEARSLGVLRHLHAKIFRAIPLGRIDETESVMRSIRDFKPKILMSHQFNLRLLSHYVDLLPERWRPRVIHTGGGEVLDNRTRRKLEEAFGCGVYSGYGSSEFGSHGFECGRQRGYHVNSDHILVEYLRDGEQVECGEPGELVVTDLSNRVMPLIRYRLGDVGVPSCELCSCGRGLPLLSSVEGRIDDLVVFSDGRILTPRQIASRLNTVKGIAIYWLTQRTFDRLELEYVRSRFYEEKTPEEIRQSCRGLWPSGVQMKVREISRTLLPQKIRPVVSEVSEKRLLNLISDIPS